MQELFIKIEKTNLMSIIENAIETRLRSENQKTSTNPKEVEFINSKDAAKLLGISLPTLNDYSKRKFIGGKVKIGTTVRYDKAKLLESINTINDKKYKRLN